MTDPVTAVASTVQLMAYLARVLDGYTNGDMTAEDVADAYNALAVRRDETRKIFEDAKVTGGYDA